MDTISEETPRSKIVLKMMLRVVFEKVNILKEKYFETSKKKLCPFLRIFENILRRFLQHYLW